MTKALAAPHIPTSAAEITPEWLTSALRARGILSDASVVGIRTEVLGEGEGFIGEIIRVHLELDRPEPGVPPTLIAKLPTGLRKNRALGELLGAYEREIRFYDELASDVDLRTPRCYFSAMDPNPLGATDEQAQRALRLLSRIPVWILRILYPVFLWLAGRSTRRYILLLEDLAPATVGDQIAGCTPEQAEKILRALARAQALLWDSPRFEEHFWISRVDLLSKGSHALFRRHRSAFFKEFGDRVPESVHALVPWLDRNGIRLMDHLGSAPEALMHGDYRLDNLFFEEDGRLTAIDWQSVGCARPTYDLAYFITGNMEIEAARRAEDRLVRAYHQELVAHGVKTYPFEECWRDYQLTKLFLLYRMILGGAMIDLSHERGQVLLDVAIARLCALLPEEHPGRLLLAS